jgi:hypothetical protein
MNRIFDYNGTIVSPSKPVKQLKTVQKTLIIDSGDRNLTQFPDNGDFVVYLPRVYENVVCIRLVGAEFPPTIGLTVGPPANKSLFTIPAFLPLYFLIELDGLNKTDECSVAADKSGNPNGCFAKIVLDGASNTDPTLYNDKSQQDNLAQYTPAIGRLDRLHIRTRFHNQKRTNTYFSWPTEYSLTLQLELLDNSFDEFSQFETHVSDRK